MDELISKEVVIDTLKAVRDLVWDVDIPSPTVPEYIEHHEQMQSIMRNIDILTDKIIKMPSAQPEIIRCNSCKHWTQTIGEMRGFGLGRCDFHDAEYVTCNGFCYWAERREE